MLFFVGVGKKVAIHFHDRACLPQTKSPPPTLFLQNQSLNFALAREELPKVPAVKALIFNWTQPISLSKPNEIDPLSNIAAMPKFFCDYCDVYLTHDSMSVRKAHNSGRNHLRNVVEYYQQIGHEKAQSVIDSITSSYAAEGQSGQNPMLAQMGPPPGAGGPPGGAGGMRTFCLLSLRQGFC